MLSLEQRNKLVRMLNKHVKEQVRLSWKGGSDPDEWERIESAAKQARARLNKFLNLLTENTQ